MVTKQRQNVWSGTRRDRGARRDLQSHAGKIKREREEFFRTHWRNIGEEEDQTVLVPAVSRKPGKRADGQAITGLVRMTGVP